MIGYDDTWDTTRLVILLYGPAVIGLCYIMSFLFSRPATAATSIIAIGIINIVITIVVFILQIVESTCTGLWLGPIIGPV